MAASTGPVTVHGLAISPAGDQAALIILRAGEAVLLLINAASAAVTADIPLGLGRPQGLTWSPNSALLAFAGPSQHAAMCNDVYLFDIATRQLRNLTPTLRRHVHLPSWSPDSAQLTFAAYEPPTNKEQPPHVYLVAVADARIEQLTAGPAADFTPHFAPDGQALAFRRDGDAWLLDLRSRQERRLTQFGSVQLSRDCFSPDSASMVFDYYYRPADLRRVGIVDVATGAVRALTPKASDCRVPAWSKTSNLIAAIEQGEHIVWYNPDGSRHQTITMPHKPIAGGFSNTPRWASDATTLVLLDREHVVWFIEPGASQRRVVCLPSPLASTCQPETISYPADDGAHVPALLFHPAPDQQVQGGVVWLHGGPHIQEPLPSLYVEALIAAGHLVLLPDYRGSSGHGAAWEELPPDEWGVTDVQDAIAGGQYLLTSEGIPTARLGVAGYSYGGYLTLLALAKAPALWAAGASLWGIFNAHRARPSQRPFTQRDEVWLAARSPDAQLDQILAPLLLLHGAHDTSATVEEAQHFADSLAARSRRCDLRIFWDDTHGLNRHTDECCALLVQFFQRHFGQAHGP